MAETVLRISTDASRNMTGLAGGSDGRIAIITNVGAFDLVLKDESASSTASNRFDIGGDITIGPQQGVMLRYDGTLSRWYCIGSWLGSPATLPIDLTTDVSGTLPIANGGTGTSGPFAAASLVFSNGTGLGSLTLNANQIPIGVGGGADPTTVTATTAGLAVLSLTNPGAVRFIRINADNTVTARSASDFLSDISGQPLDATLTALAGANWAANALPIGTGADTLSQTSFAANTFPARASTGDLVAKTITDFGLSLVDDANAAAGRSTLGATTVGGNIFTAANPSAVRWIRVNADNTITFRTAAETLSDVGGGAGTVTTVGSADGSVTVTNGTTTPDLALNGNFFMSQALVNGSLTATVAANALTIALKIFIGGVNPSASAPIHTSFRSATAANGDNATLTVTAATSLVISSGSTMGVASATPFRLWVVAFNDGGTFRLGAINCLSGKSIYHLREQNLASSTAEGGAGAADSAQVFYTGTAVTTKAYRVLGYLEWGSGLTTAGTWDAAPTKIHSYTPGSALPGHLIQEKVTFDGAVATGTTTIPADDTIPQSTEGDQYLSQAITPTSSANVLEITTMVYGALTAASNSPIIALFQDSTANALASGWGSKDGGTTAANVHLMWDMLANTTSSTTFKVRVGGNTAGTFTFNGGGGARSFGGTMASHIRVKEIMA